MPDDRKLCFVVMGFGKKTDYLSGRTLDLDATYQAIIAPAAEAADLRCIRADDVMHSGVIDTTMYDMLLRADLVIADISTGNVNAVYELGVRHALRPYSTIIMKEKEGQLYFDLNHLNTFHYEHLGPDIGSREASRASRDLRALIDRVLETQSPDSPVYTYLPKLQQPRLSDEEFDALVENAEAAQERLTSLVAKGEAAGEESRHADAAEAFRGASTLKPGDPYVIQRLALFTYKSKFPSEMSALIEGLSIISALDPANSNDPETLGIAASMHKRIWLLTEDRVQLDLAVRLYGRGFELRRDYYNGENLALCYDLRAKVQEDPSEAQYDRMSAAKVRQAVVDVLLALVASPSFSDRSDQKWVYASLATCSYALGRRQQGERYEVLFRSREPAEWEISTFEQGQALALGG